ncbi:hypothetical protein SAMN02745247_02157 [Butyrivibrio hungatei DSM 14810]|uniref:Uncharacterized protein n=1 Tax=Butyrivibrio hungatei DSM 14810 TaxID=1121132 RepID=A0A1M7SNG7_9FIRM|nr:hypothetical protein [Butyrivibrio hungatei]SHN60021.1 hypothetical protein SAMN02745247_02157 [Butyrivibrio hungatei DSM 14810]
MKKKFLVAMLAMMIMASSVACGKTDTDKGPLKAGEESSEASFEIKEDSADEASSEASVEEAVEAASEASSEEATEVTADEAAGYVDGQAYINENFNLKFNIDSDMSFADEQAVADLNNAAGDFTNDTIKKYVDEGKVMIVAYATDDTMLKSFNVALQSVGSLVTTLVDEETVLNASAGSVVDLLTQQGFEDVTTEVDKVQFMGEEHSSLLISAKIQGIDYYERVCCLVDNGYVMSLTTGGLTKDDVTHLFENAEKLN